MWIRLKDRAADSPARTGENRMAREINRGQKHGTIPLYDNDDSVNHWPF